MKVPLPLQSCGHSPKASLQVLLQGLPSSATIEHQVMESSDLSGSLNTVSTSTLGRQGLASTVEPEQSKFALPVLWATGKICNCINTVPSLN